MTGFKPGRIPVCDLRPQVNGLRTEVEAALERVWSRGWFILGEEGERFEEEFSRYLGASYAVGVASGTDAIHLALRAAGIEPGDLVLTAPNSAVPTACGIAEAGAVPCFADIDLQTGLLDPASVEAHLHERVRAIVVVHLYGQCVPMEPILELAQARGLPVIEDAAQAHGASWKGRRAGTLGTLGCFSFYPTKNLGAYGDGGAVVGGEPSLCDGLRLLRNYGQEDRYHHVRLGFNSRLDEVQAAVLRVKLPLLEEWNRRRESIAARYEAAFRDQPLALTARDPDGSSCHHLFTVRVARRDRFREKLDAAGVDTQIHYPIPIHLQPAFAALGYAPGSFPRAELRARQVVTLPLFPELEDDRVERVIGAVIEALRGEPHPEELS